MSQLLPSVCLILVLISISVRAQEAGRDGCPDGMNRPPYIPCMARCEDDGMKCREPAEANEKNECFCSMPEDVEAIVLNSAGQCINWSECEGRKQAATNSSNPFVE